MKRILLMLTLLLNLLNANAQKEDKHDCATDELHWKKLKDDPEYKAKFEKYNEGWIRYVKEGEVKKTTTANKSGNTATPPDPDPPTITLTVAFHDLTTASSVALSTDYNTIIGLLNEVYKGNIIQPGKLASINTGIQFCLAKEDKRGIEYNQLNSVIGNTNITSVDRLNLLNVTNVLNASYQGSGVPFKNVFPSLNFINIYIVDEIDGPVAGFATFPSDHGALTDGIFIERTYLQSNVIHNMNVLIHEMGHYLGLYHVFGMCDPLGLHYDECYCVNTDCNANGDMVCDTPPIELHNVDCLAPAFISCHGAPYFNTVTDERNNYMDYFDWDCLHKFTSDQRKRIRYTINENGGIRGSLFKDCPGCLTMYGCQYSISAPSNSAMVNNQLHVGDSAVLNIAVTGCTSASGPPVNPAYLWELTQLGNTNAVIGTANTANFTVPNSLGEGNYQVRLTVTVSPNCFRETIYSFTVLPITLPNSCNLILPTDNTAWGVNWQRATYSGGWQVSQTPPFSYIPSTAIRTAVNSPTPEYDVIPASAVSSDPNFSTVTNTPTALTTVIRVGRMINGPVPQDLIDGAAAYAAVKFHPTKQNCKYRVYYLGLSNKTYSTSPSTSTAFGFVCQYKFDSPVTTPAPQETIVGSSESGLVLGSLPFSAVSPLAASDYDLNDMVFGSSPASLIAAEDTTIFGTPYNIMKAWRYVDVDFSEFVDANTENLNTEITVTFYARSNIALEAKSHSYAYFGVQCMGGGLPKDYTLNLTDVTAFCSGECVVYNGNNVITRPNYAKVKNNVFLPWLRPALNFGRVQLAYSNDGFTYTTVPEIVFPSDTSTFPFNLCYMPNGNTNQFTFWKITVKTLHKTVEQVIKVYKSALSFTPPPLDFTCPGPIYGGHIPGQNIILYCPSDPMPTLTYMPESDICFGPTNGPLYEYRWIKQNEGAIQNAEDDHYTLKPNDLATLTSCFTITRQVKTIGVSYCGSAEYWMDGESYKIYKLDKLFTFTKKGKDICRDGTYTLEIKNFKSGTTCDIPHGLITAGTNNVTIELVTGSTILTSYTITDFNYSLAGGYNFNMSFSNINGTQFFLNQTQDIIIRVKTNINGCPVTTDFSQQVIIKQSAIGGSIELSNDCSVININNSQFGFSYPSGNVNSYVWEIAQPGGPFLPLVDSVTPTNTNGPSLLNFQLYGILLPVQIRRVSVGSPECSAPDYSNIITVNPPNVVPVFNNLLTCSGSVLPMTSNNFITGIWNPTTVTATTTSYTFTPNPGQCAVPLTSTIISTPLVTTTFTQVPSICVGGTLAALPTTSTNGITGSWSPTTLNTNQTTTYIFTPNANQCATTATMTITVNPILTPTFGAVAPICSGSTLAPLPVTSLNSITGSWTPALSNTAGNTYTFTPNAGQCATTTASLNIVVNAKVNPTFTNIPTSVCLGGTLNPLPATSSNSVAITGAWSPSVNNLVTTTYTFTPNAGQCANTATVTIPVLSNVPPPMVTPVNYCLNDVPVPLTATGMTGGQFYWYLPPGDPRDSVTPVTNVAGQTIYFVAQSAPGYCQSPQVPIVVNVYTPPAITTITQPTCDTPSGSVTFSGLTLASPGWTLNTLTSTGVVISSTSNLTTPSITGIAPGIHYYSVVNSSGCTTAVPFTVTINAVPETQEPPKIKVAQPSCISPTGGVELYGLTAGNWIVNQTGPMGAVVQTFTGTSVQISNLISGTYNFTVTNSMGCTSVSVQGIINASLLPDPLIAEVVQPSCPHQEGSVVLTGMVVPGDWHITQTGTVATTYDGSDSSLTINHLPVGVYNFTVKYNGCESVPITVTMLEATTPLAPDVISPLEYNIGDIAIPLTATGQNLNWYYPTDTEDFDGTPTPSTDFPGDFVYYVTQTVNGCESPPIKIIVKVISPCDTYDVWDGTSWSNGVPTLTTYVKINGDYDMQFQPSFDACSVLVKAPFKVIVTANNWVNIQNNLTVETGATFDVQDDGSLVQIDDAGINHGNIIYRRDVNINKFDYVYWSSPVSNFITNNISPGSPTWSIFKWGTTTPNPNGGEGFWVSAINETMEAAKGYIVRGPLDYPVSALQNFEAVFENGVPNNGLIAIPITKGTNTAPGETYPPGGNSTNSTPTTAQTDNYNLIGNPYPSAIDPNFFLDANDDNILGSLYFWVHGLPLDVDQNPFYSNYVLSYNPMDLQAYTPLGSQNGPAPIKITGGQAFIVLLKDDLSVPNTGISAVFNNSMRSKDFSNVNFFKNSNQNTSEALEKSRIWLDLADANHKSVRTLMGYMTNATAVRDDRFDAYLKDGAQMSIFSLIGEERMIIQARALPFDDNDQIPLGITIATAGTYTVAISTVDGIFDNGQDIYIEDMLLNQFHDLKVSPYSFTSTPGRFLSRFRIVYKLPPPTETVFNPIASVCSGSTISPLPTTSINGITGTWAPAISNTVTTTYTFTPNADQNATNVEMTITITPQTVYYQDLDNDGYGNAAVTATSCATTLAGYVTNASDCNDANASIHPGAVDLCYDGIDNDCNGVIDNVGQANGCTPIVTTLTTASCGSIVTALSTTINAVPVANAQGYRFKVTNMASGAVQLLDRSVNSFSFTNLSGIVLATQYKVEVAVKLDNVWQPFYGAPCFVTTPIPYTQIGNSQCNITLNSIWDVVYCNQVSGMTNYHFKAVASTGAVVEFNSTSNSFHLNRLGIQFATTYTISVSVYQDNGNWVYGNPCTITTPAQPARTTISNCGAVLSSFWTTIFITQVTTIVGIPVTGYRVELSDAVGGIRTLDIATSGFNLKNTNFTPFVNPTANTVYTIRIALLWNGAYQEYGSACTISTAANATKAEAPVLRDKLVAMVMPNPFSDTFTISIQSPSSEAVRVSVYDMIGKLIDRFEIEGAQNTHQLGDKYPSGVYNIILNQAETVKSIRIIKR